MSRLLPVKVDLAELRPLEAPGLACVDLTDCPGFTRRRVDQLQILTNSGDVPDLQTQVGQQARDFDLEVGSRLVKDALSVPQCLEFRHDLALPFTQAFELGQQLGLVAEWEAIEVRRKFLAGRQFSERAE